jgi:hypothetical protein
MKAAPISLPAASPNRKSGKPLLLATLPLLGRAAEPQKWKTTFAGDARWLSGQPNAAVVSLRRMKRQF